MPAVRLARRRRSSLAISFTPAKAGIYGIPRPVTFAPNVTALTYEAPEGSSSSTTPEPSSPTSSLFPPSQTPAPPPSRRRVPPGKRRSMGYIPRPPNAFMLFRADFVRQKHVPGTIETNHGSLSKIIGNCWRSLPLDEKRVWEVKAKHAKAEHKVQYPEYRFRPVHNKNKDKKKEKPLTTVEDERRCEEVAQLLLEGKKGDELAAAVRDLDLMRAETPLRHNQDQDQEQHNTNNTNLIFQHRRSSSVPLPNDYYPHFPTFQPTQPFFAPGGSRPHTPIGGGHARQERMMLGARRASSARPAAGARSWTLPIPLQRDDSPLPDVDTSLFEPSFLHAAAGFTFPGYSDDQHQHLHLHPHFDMNGNVYDHLQHCETQTQTQAQTHSQNPFGPLDNISPHDILTSSWANHPSPFNNANTNAHPSPYDSPLPLSSSTTCNSHPSTAYSGSPSSYSEPLPSSYSEPLPSSYSEPHPLPLPMQVHAPQPQSASAASVAFADMWKEFGGGSFSSDPALCMHMHLGMGMGMGAGGEMNNVGVIGGEMDMGLGVGGGMEGVYSVDSTGLGLGLDFSAAMEGEVQMGGGGGVGMDMGAGAGAMGCGVHQHQHPHEHPHEHEHEQENVFGNTNGCGELELELELESLFAPQEFDAVAFDGVTGGVGYGEEDI